MPKIETRRNFPGGGTKTRREYNAFVSPAKKDRGWRGGRRNDIEVHRERDREGSVEPSMSERRREKRCIGNGDASWRSSILGIESSRREREKERPLM